MYFQLGLLLLLSRQLVRSYGTIKLIGIWISQTKSTDFFEMSSFILKEIIMYGLLLTSSSDLPGLSTYLQML